MRVTSSTFPDSLLRHLQRTTTEMNSLSEQSATGQRISKMSDDSAAANRILDMQEEKGKITQYTKNASRAVNINNTTISQLNNFINISDRVSEIATLANDTKGQEGLQAYAEEVDELIEHALQSANARFNGEYIFGGTASGSEPFQANKDADGNIVTGAGDAISYVGAENGPEFHLSEGGKISPFTSGNTNRQFADFINRMVDLRDALQSGTQNAVTDGMRADLENSEDELIFSLSRQGSIQMRIEFDTDLNKQRFTDLENNISAEADVDLAQTVVRLTQVQNAYQATLQSAGQVLNSSLLQYI